MRQILDFSNTVVSIQQQRIFPVSYLVCLFSWLLYRFNRTLMNQRAVAMGKEFRGKGVNIQLGPFM